MDFPITASGTHVGTGQPLLLMPDQDHPNTMNQIVWSLMYILQQAGIAGAEFDPDVTSTYNKLWLAISGMIAASATPLATVPETRTGALTTKATTPAGVTAATGNYSKYVSVETTPYAVLDTDVGGLHIATASSNAITLPLLSTVARVGCAYHFINLKTTGTVTISRNGANVLAGVAGSTTAVVLKPGQSIQVVAISATTWAVIGASVIDTQNTQIGIGCPLWHPCRALITNGFVAADGQLGNRSTYPVITSLLGTLPTVTEANWVSTYANRGSYSSGDDATTFRFPDYNGKYGADVALFFRGDGGNAAAVGQIVQSTNKLHQHQLSDYNATAPDDTPADVDSYDWGWDQVPWAGLNEGAKSTPSFRTTFQGSVEAAPEHVAGVWAVRAY